ncbi:MAG: nicotinamide mononucleotide transporter [Clostridia bacterium]|nr:nicotinamide mononucleotide transporter [Clostridia bacterium]
MGKLKKYLSLTPFEICLWVFSVTVSVVSYILSPENGLLNFIASVIGVTAILFIAKGRLLGQILSAVFSLLYGFISLKYAYYGELITYMGMTFPMAVLSIISWAKNPYKDTGEVTVARVSRRGLFILGALAVLVTAGFYFILSALDTRNLIVSTVSVTTSFVACGLTFLRSPYYALWYSANDVILIVLWGLAAINDSSYIIMVICFGAFLANDLYAFFNWRRMRKRQKEEE